MKRVAIIVAGGKGIRMKSEIPKQFLLLKNKPILIHTIESFIHFDERILVLPKSQFEYWNKLCFENNFKLSHKIVEGGNTRFQSVKNGLKKVDDDSVVAIHDGVRPLVSENLINSLVNEVEEGIGVIPVVPLTDSIREVVGEYSKHLDRNNVFKVQTPQCFLSSEIKEAYSQEYSITFTDDASVFENNSGKIKTIVGEEKNLKITTAKDLKISSYLL